MRKAFSLVEVLVALFLVAMVISTVLALRSGGHRAQVRSETVERLQSAVHALGRHAAEQDFRPLAQLAGRALGADWLRAAGADPDLLTARIEATTDPDVLRFVAEARAGRVRCVRLLVRPDGSLARSFALESR